MRRRRFFGRDEGRARACARCTVPTDPTTTCAWCGYDPSDSATVAALNDRRARLLSLRSDRPARQAWLEVMRGLSNHEHPAAALLSRAEDAVAGRRRRRRRAVKLQMQRRLVVGEIEELVRAYEAGATILELRDRFEISRTTVIAHLRRAGVETRYCRLEGRLDEAKRLYEQGWSWARVAAYFDVSAGTVQNAFYRAGVPIRPVGTNQWSGRRRSS